MGHYQVCSVCVLDTSFPALRFDEAGQCDACKRAIALRDRVWLRGPDGRARLDEMSERLQLLGKGKRYDAMIGISGGIDSAYLAHMAVCEMGLRVLAVHVDAGWNSVQAVRNIGRLVQSLDLDLYTHVIEWSDMRDLQLSFLRSHVLNQDIPQDHAFFSNLYRVAAKFDIDFFLSGVNFATENATPPGSGTSYMDARHIRALHGQFGDGAFRQFQPMGITEYLWRTQIVKKPKSLKPLNLIDYDKEKAHTLLKNTYGWEDYGPKHSESRWTKFYQEVYLPRKFGIDKRRIHLSSLIVAGSMTRGRALEELRRPMLNYRQELQQTKFITKKLGLKFDEFEELINAPGSKHEDYPNQKWIFDFLVKFRRVFQWFASI